MMSKKQWFVLFCLFIIYILLGSTFFYYVQSHDEAHKREIEKEERKIIEELINKHYNSTMEDTKPDLFQKLTNYCGKPMLSNVTDEEDPPKWDFYHAVFFSVTVVTTVGYGNLAPTTMLGRIVMMFYSLIGISVNSIVMLTLGDYFGKSFVKLYRRWKTAKMEYDTTRLGLISQIVLYLVPGFTFFIFLPAFIIMAFEEWDYDVAVYYCFVTITTIGFGDIVAGVNKPGQGTVMWLAYKIFLLVWIIIGLGYGLMVLGFISRGLRSKKIRAIEHALAMNIKKTPHKIRSELRSLVHEFLLLKVKRVYKHEFVYTPHKIERSQSCPDLRIYDDNKLVVPAMNRRRACSACVFVSPLIRMSSDSDLTQIDMERTFPRKLSEQSNLLLRVANALGSIDNEEIDDNVNTIRSLNQESRLNIPFVRKRACSEVKFPQKLPENKYQNDLTWYGKPSFVNLQEIREGLQYGKARSRTLPIQPPNIFSKIKNTIKGTSNKDNKDVDVEKQESAKVPIPRTNSEAINKYVNNTRHGRPSILHQPSSDSVLEETSIADFLRMLANISIDGEEDEEPKPVPNRKLGTASLTPPDLSPMTRRAILNSCRKGSLMPPSHNPASGRRFSLRPSNFLEPSPPKRVNLNPNTLEVPSSHSHHLSPPPPYTPFATTDRDVPGRRSIRVPGSNRRYSLRPVLNLNQSSTGPVQRQVRKRDDSYSERL
nr:open rectifier potassium channel protein 1-like isoform X1 [Onthophagus taurus]